MRRLIQILPSLVVIAGLLVTCVPGSHAQSAQITGRVTDPSGAVVPGVEIAVTNVRTGVQKTTVTNGAGIYVIPFLVPGTYAMKVEMAWFKSIARPATKLDVDQVARMDFALEVGAMTESVTVTEAAP